MKNIVLCAAFVCFQVSYAVELGLGFYNKQEKVQNSKGEEDSDPFSPMFLLGHTFNISSGYVFSPALGYIKHEVNSDDSYGEYEVTTLALIYDLIWAPGMSASDGYSIRYGIGNFMRKTKGKGGAVTVPNGTGTATAYRPGSETTSYSTSFNIGAELFFSPLIYGLSLNGLRGEMYWFHPFNDSKRTYAFNIMYVGYF